MKVPRVIAPALHGVRGIPHFALSLDELPWEVIDLLKATRSTDEIAAELVLSTETVRSHVKNILRKLNVCSREEAVATADRMRNTSPLDEPDSGSREA